MLRGRGGATIAAVMGRKQGDVVSLNVGDSRIYGIGESRDLKQISKDDTLAGYLGQGPMDRHQNQLVQFVGMGEGIEPHIFTSLPNAFESLLVTSDGIHNVPLQAFSEAIRHPSSNYDLADRLLSLSDSLGGRDNATVVLLPTQLKHSNNPREQGLTLEFLSVSDRLEIWIPAIAEDSQHQDAPESLREASGARIKSEQEPAAKKKKETKAGTRQMKSKKMRKHGRPNHPDQPALDITFPQKGEN
jgi:serine/threonine protein phosphatase PrpC